MFASVLSGVITGIESHMVSVEADVTNGLPGMLMVGFLASEVKEAQERVRSAIHNSGIRLEPKKITVNLSPADLRKAGSGFDLPIAVAVMTAYGYILPENTKDIFLAGELSLDGHLNGIRGILCMVQKAKESGCRACIVPESNAGEAALVTGIEVYGASTFQDVMQHLMDIHKLKSVSINIEEILSEESVPVCGDFADVQGQQTARRAAEIAAAGRHNLLLTGPPGSGKSMIAKRIVSILPRMSIDEALEVSRIHSIAGILPVEGLVRERPFRMPHHTISAVGLSGGGMIPRPGEISLAHRGVLFLDELPEFMTDTLEILRQPLEDHRIFISRASGTYVFPADFILIASRNPCKCGYWPDRTRCHCREYEVKKYLHRISRPLLDRIDLHVTTEPVRYEELMGHEAGESSATIRERVENVRRIQQKRYSGSSVRFNGELPSEKIREYCPLGPQEEDFLREIFEQKKLTARTTHKLLKVARTIADLDQEERIHLRHLAEAVSYRPVA